MNKPKSSISLKLNGKRERNYIIAAWFCFQSRIYFKVTACTANENRKWFRRTQKFCFHSFTRFTHFDVAHCLECREKEPAK